MEETFWQARWDEKRIGFHEGKPNEILARHADALLVGSDRVLVPMCGKAADLEYLASRVREVVGVELIKEAVSAYFSEREIEPVVDNQQEYVSFRHEGLQLLQGDVLALTREAVGSFQLIYDRAALIALPATMRGAYAKVMSALTDPGARMLLVALEHDRGDGPPFSIGSADVATLYSKDFEIQALEAADITADSPHLTAAGASSVVEQAYLLRRR